MGKEEAGWGYGVRAGGKLPLGTGGTEALEAPAVPAIKCNCYPEGWGLAWSSRGILLPCCGCELELCLGLGLKAALGEPSWA